MTPACRGYLLTVCVACLLAGGGSFAFSSTQLQRATESGAFSTGIPRSEVCGYPPQLSALALSEGEVGGGASREELFTWINFIILVAALVYVLRKPIRAFFTGRSREVHESLEAGRRALEESQARLAEVEAKLAHLEEEIATFKASALQEMQAERVRVRESTEREAARILDWARLQIETSARVARLDLTAHTAGETVRLAEEMIRQRLDDATRERLVSRFVGVLRAGQSSPGKN